MQNFFKYIKSLFKTLIVGHKRHKFEAGQLVDLKLYGHNTKIKIVASDYKSRCYKVKWLDDGKITLQTKEFINKFSV